MMYVCVFFFGGWGVERRNKKKRTDIKAREFLNIVFVNDASERNGFFLS